VLLVMLWLLVSLTSPLFLVLPATLGFLFL
jgi:hypothetical protein